MNPTVIEGRTAFTDAVKRAVDEAANAGERALCFVDADFAEWPLNDRELIASLVRWVQPQRRLTMLARRYDEVPRRHPRFAEFRRTYAHVITCRAAAEVDASEMPTLLMAGPASLQLLDRVHLRGRWLADDTDRRTWSEVIDAISQRSEEAFPASTLGL